MPVIMRTTAGRFIIEFTEDIQDKNIKTGFEIANRIQNPRYREAGFALPFDKAAVIFEPDE